MLNSLDDSMRMPIFESSINDNGLESILQKVKEACKRTIDETVETIFSYDDVKIVACSATFIQLYSSLALLKTIKEQMPHVITMIGGCECEGVAAKELVDKLSFVDYAFSGEGDETFANVVSKCLSADEGVEDLPLGVYGHSDTEYEMLECAMVPASCFASPDHSDFISAFKESPVLGTLSPIMTFEFSRGCWKGQKSPCSFCGFNGRRMNFRQKNSTRILQELLRMYSQGIRFFQATDTVLDLNATREILNKFSEKCPDGVIVCDVVSTLSQDQLSFLAESGVLFLQVGIETLHPKHVKLLNKGNSSIGSIAFLKYAKENGITIFWNILTSIPGDSASDYDEMVGMLPLLEHLSPPNFGVIRFDRFSEYWCAPYKYGLKLIPIHNCQYLIPKNSGLNPNHISMYFDNLNESARTNYKSDEIIKISKAIDAWKNAAAKRPVLLFSEGKIVDTRAVAEEAMYYPSSEELNLLKFLNKPRTRDEIDSNYFNAQDILNRLHRRKYILYWEEKYLSLIMEKNNSPSYARQLSIDYRMRLCELILQKQREIGVYK
jgi:magnesium-protoporphyrin IX monomethyl ester (oxidative) cyclase